MLPHPLVCNRARRLYKSIGNLVGIELDLAQIKQSRPKVARLLRGLEVE
jgi:hypothetical protein